VSRLHDALGVRRERDWRRPREAPRSLDQLGWTPIPNPDSDRWPGSLAPFASDCWSVDCFGRSGGWVASWAEAWTE